MLLQLIYVSSATNLFSEEELVELLRKSRENNENKDISGLLLYHEGNFMQLLEGPEEAVLALYERIRKDLRHHDPTILVQAPIEARMFPEWSMAFENVEKLVAAEAGASDFLNTPLTAAEFAGRPSRALVLLRSFRDRLARRQL